VVKRPGLIIKPIEFKEVNPHENTEGHKRSGQKQKMKKSKSSDGGKARKKMKKTEG
jgi:U3 small nucleolar RNA-associated protein 14